VYVAITYGCPMVGLTVMLAGHVMMGGLDELTVTVNGQLDCKFALLVVVHVTVVVPTVKFDPDN
jgi:hypothetical protein